jgi:hypothetical protein
MLTQEGGLPNLLIVSGENGMKVSKEISVLIAIQIQQNPDRRLAARFHNRAEDDTSFAARQLRGGGNLNFRSLVRSPVMAQDNKKQDSNKEGSKKNPNQGGGSQDRNSGGGPGGNTR